MYMEPQVIYQADFSEEQELPQNRDRLRDTLTSHIGRTVHVQTLDGFTYEGILVHVDEHYVHLQVSLYEHPYHGMYRGFYNPAASTILTLVLYELLVIALLA